MDEVEGVDAVVLDDSSRIEVLDPESSLCSGCAAGDGEDARVAVDPHALEREAPSCRPGDGGEGKIRGTGAEIEQAKRAISRPHRTQPFQFAKDRARAAEVAIDEPDETEARLERGRIDLGVVHVFRGERSMRSHGSGGKSSGQGSYHRPMLRISSLTRSATHRIHGASLLAATVCGSVLAGTPHQDAAPKPESNPQVVRQQVAVEDLPWPMVLGLRTMALEQRLPVVETVVLVPDEATFLAEIARWSPSGRWPVLFEDDRYAPLFIKRFAPRRVFRRAAVAAAGSDPAMLEARASEAVIRAFGGDPARQTLAEVFTAAAFVPAGVVFTDFSDPAWPAAVALAAGRGQILATLEGDFGGIADVADASTVRRLRSDVQRELGAIGIPWAGTKDPIEAITLCLDLPAKANLDLPEPQRVRIAVPGLKPTEDLAITDLVGRLENGERFAVVGQIFGPRNRCLYAAMASLFLPRDRICLFNTYQSDGDWAVYGVGDLEAGVESIGFEAETFAGTAAEIRGWLKVQEGETPPDVLFLNSSGEPNRMSLASGQSAQTADVPRLRRPLALHMIHSFSMARPGDARTIGAAWLDAGVYAYVGAVSEPYLASFIPPRFVLERLANLIPFLAASRQYEGPFSPSWRVMTYGDPLMLAAPPAQHRLPRIPPPGHELVDGEDLREAAKESMRAAASPDADSAAITRAMLDLRLLGEVELASRFWASVRDRPAAKGAAMEALRALFEADQFRAFLETWRTLNDPDPEAVTMLWQLCGPRIGAISDPDIIRLLQANLRGPRTWLDLERILPAIRSALGPGIARRLVQREIDAAKNSTDQRELRRLLDSLGDTGRDGGVDASTPNR